MLLSDLSSNLHHFGQLHAQEGRVTRRLLQASAREPRSAHTNYIAGVASWHRKLLSPQSPNFKRAETWKTVSSYLPSAVTLARDAVEATTRRACICRGAQRLVFNQPLPAAMVFFTRVLKRTLHVHPQHLGPQLERTVKEQLHRDVEGMTVDTSGYVVSVLSVTLADLQKGRIDHLTGFVRYDVSFNALVFRPFRNEVIVATVKAVSDVRAAAGVCPDSRDRRQERRSPPPCCCRLVSLRRLGRSKYLSRKW